MIYPLIKGSKNIKAGYGQPEENIGILLPNKGISASDYKKAKTQLENLPRTKKYLNTFKTLLEERSTYKKFMHGAPYWAVYNVGEYTLKPYKVVWSEIGTHLVASIFEEKENRPFIPDHKVYFAAFDNKDDAIFLMCLLNNDSVSNLINNSTVSTSRGNILKNLHLPKYDNRSVNHQNVVTNFKKNKNWLLNNTDLTNKVLFM